MRTPVYCLWVYATIAYSIIQSCFERVEHVKCAQCQNVSCFGRELLLSDYNHLEYGVVDEDR